MLCRYNSIYLLLRLYVAITKKAVIIFYARKRSVADNLNLYLTFPEK